jgi:hypothetical protein
LVLSCRIYWFRFVFWWLWLVGLFGVRLLWLSCGICVWLVLFVLVVWIRLVGFCVVFFGCCCV